MILKNKNNNSMISNNSKTKKDNDLLNISN